MEVCRARVLRFFFPCAASVGLEFSEWIVIASDAAAAVDVEASGSCILAPIEDEIHLLQGFAAMPATESAPAKDVFDV